MPHLRVQHPLAIENVAIADQSQSSSLPVSLRTRHASSSQRQFKDLKQENLELRLKLAMVQEEYQRIRTAAHLETSSLKHKLDISERERKSVVDTALTTQCKIVGELKALIRSSIRLDTQDVVQNRARMTLSELDTQLEWYKAHRGVDVLKTGTRELRIARWAKVVQDYRTEVEEMLGSIPPLEGLIMSAEGSAMDVDEDYAL